MAVLRGRCPDCWEVIVARNPPELINELLGHVCKQNEHAA